MDETAAFSSSTAYIRIDNDDAVIDDDGESDSASSSVAYIDRLGSTSTDQQNAGDIPWGSARLRLLNLLNVVAYCSNGIVSLGIGIWGFGGVLPSVREVTKTHLTLMTPAVWTGELVWVPIFFFEGLFCIAQLLPTFRGRPAVLEGAGYFFIYACMAQIAWTMFFSFCLFMLAFVSQCIILASLSCLLISQFISRSQEESRREYWLLRFPFSMHTGWIFVSTAINWNMLSLEYGVSESTQLASAIVSMALLLTVSFLFLGAMTRHSLVVPAIIIWAFVGIYWELRYPSDQVVSRFGMGICDAFRRSTLACAIIAACAFVTRVAVILFRECFTIHVVQH